jgi:uncharacterized protein (DUF1501 family)
MKLDLTRRQFLKGASATALMAGTHVLSLARPASGADFAGRVLVLINLNGGNDALNTVMPLNDVGAPMRSLYQSLRPDLAIPTSALAGFELGPDPVLGTDLALHPQCAGLKTLYDEGKLALVNGVGLAESPLSHFDAENVWFTGDPSAPKGTGWIGRQMDVTWGDGDARAIAFGDGPADAFTANACDVLGVRTLVDLELPDDPWPRYGDLAARTAAWNAVYGENRGPGMTDTIAASGATLVNKASLFGQIQTTGWGSLNETETWGIGRELRETASVLRFDAPLPGSNSGVCFYHVRQNNFDTHSRQGTTDPAGGHPRLMDQLSRALYGFQRDLEAIGVADKVVTLCFSEFGRRAYQNDSGSSAGTDHGRGGMLMLVGNGVAGGLHGMLPALDDLDPWDNLKVNTDFRGVYASLIDDWLGSNHTAVLPGGPFAKVPVIA